MDLPAFVQAAADLPILQAAFESLFVRTWASAHTRTEHNTALDFGPDQIALRQIWDDPWPRRVLMKSAQAGGSVLAYSWAMHRAFVRGQTGIYTLPTEGDVDDFVGGRLDRVIDYSPVLKAALGRDRVRRPAGGKPPVDNNGLKHLGAGALYFRGTQTDRGAVSVPAQYLVRDELDLSVPRVLEMFDERLAATPAAQRAWIDLSTPTGLNVGIHARYLDSDQREWHVHCACGWTGPLDYDQHTDGHLLYLRCTECGEMLDPRDGAWVVGNPGADVHGYHISRLLFCVPERPDRLAAIHHSRQNAKYPHLFTNMVLGLPARQSVQSVTKEDLVAVAFRDPYLRQVAALYTSTAYYLGMDQGDTLTWVVVRADPILDGDNLRVVALGRFRDDTRGMGAWYDAAELMTRYRIVLAVVDGNPNSGPAHDLANRFPSRVLLCYYSESSHATMRISAAAQAQLLEGLDSRQAITPWDITVNRTESLDQTTKLLREGRYLLPSPPTDPETDELMQQVAHNIRRATLTSRDELVYRWEKTGPNDYAHALNYARIAVQTGRDLAQVGYTPSAPIVITGFTRH